MNGNSNDDHNSNNKYNNSNNILKTIVITHQ